MNLSKLFTEDDRSVALILFFLVGLVFAPVIGLHVVLGSSGAAKAHAAPVSGLASAPVGVSTSGGR
jgi:hypothetical protein